MSNNTLTSEQLLNQAFGIDTNTIPNTEVQQALGNNNQKSSKAIGVKVSVVTVTKQDSSLFIGSAFSIDVGFLEPYQYDKGLPQQNGESLKSQIFYLSVQRQHEEFSLMKAVAEEMLAKGEREKTLVWSELDAEKYPFTYATWRNSTMTWHFINTKVARPSGDKLSADKVTDILAQIL